MAMIARDLHGLGRSPRPNLFLGFLRGCRPSIFAADNQDKSFNEHHTKTNPQEMASPIPYIIYTPVIPMKLTLIASRQVSFSSCFPLLSSSDDSFLRGLHQTPRLSKQVYHYCLSAHNPVDKECKSTTGRLLSCSAMLWRSRQPHCLWQTSSARLCLD